MTEAVARVEARPGVGVVGRLSLLDCFLPLWIFLAMTAGVGLGYIFPGIATAFDALRIDRCRCPSPWASYG